MFTFVLWFLFCIATQCQTVEDGWKGIKPLRTNKAEVEKLLGKPGIDSSGFYGYKTNEAFVRVNYSTTPCNKSEMGRGDFNVPQGTVLDYHVILEKPVLISELNFKRNDYYRDTSGHSNGNPIYATGDHSIIISAFIRDGVEFASRFDYRPSKKDAEEFTCQPIGQKIEDGWKMEENGIRIVSEE